MRATVTNRIIFMLKKMIERKVLAGPYPIAKQWWFLTFEIARIESLVRSHRIVLREDWNEYFGEGN
jgi:hypothetical protein